MCDKKERPGVEATLTFNMEDHYSKLELKRMLKATDMALAINSLQDRIGREINNGDPKQVKKFEEFQDILSELLYKYEIRIDEILE